MSFSKHIHDFRWVPISIGNTLGWLILFGFLGVVDAPVTIREYIIWVACAFFALYAFWDHKAKYWDLAHDFEPAAVVSAVVFLLYIAITGVLG